MARLTDLQKKKIVADYAEMRSYIAVAKKHNISDHTVKKICESDPKFARKCEGKSEQNAKDILSHMESKKEKINQIIDVYLDALLDPTVIAKSSASQLTTALGTLIDKFTAAALNRSEKEVMDDPLTKALEEEAERMNNGDFS